MIPIIFNKITLFEKVQYLNKITIFQQEYNISTTVQYFNKSTIFQRKVQTKIQTYSCQEHYDDTSGYSWYFKVIKFPCYNHDAMKNLIKDGTRMINNVINVCGLCFMLLLCNIPLLLLASLPLL